MRVGATLGLVRLRDPGALPAVRDVAIGYARAASGRLAGYAARTVSDRIADGIAADGSIPPATLLQLAAQAYGPIPGVRLPPGRAGRPPLDGTVLLERLVAAADRFTPAQRRALEGVLFPARRRRAGRGPPDAARGRHVPACTRTTTRCSCRRARRPRPTATPSRAASARSR